MAYLAVFILGLIPGLLLGAGIAVMLAANYAGALADAAIPGQLAEGPRHADEA